jgi:hypothetical protein
MRLVENIIALSLSKLDREEMAKGKAEAREIALREGRQWIEVYYERNLADRLRHYEPSIPKALTVDEYESVIDLIDIRFQRMLEEL